MHQTRNLVQLTDFTVFKDLTLCFSFRSVFQPLNQLYSWKCPSWMSIISDLLFLQVVILGKHSRGYHYMLANLVRTKYPWATSSYWVCTIGSHPKRKYRKYLMCSLAACKNELSKCQNLNATAFNNIFVLSAELHFLI